MPRQQGDVADSARGAQGQAGEGVAGSGAHPPQTTGVA